MLDVLLVCLVWAFTAFAPHMPPLPQVMDDRELVWRYAGILTGRDADIRTTQILLRCELGLKSIYAHNLALKSPGDSLRGNDQYYDEVSSIIRVRGGLL